MATLLAIIPWWALCPMKQLDRNGGKQGRVRLPPKLKSPLEDFPISLHWLVAWTNLFYAPEAHIIYLTVSSSFLISFVMGEGGGEARVGRLSCFMHLSGPSRMIKFLYAPAPPTPSVWALKPPSWALMHKTTYAPMIYTSL